MDRLEKVEKLRERANVSYEEAKAALEQSNDDLLDAMVLLERQGKTKAPGQTSYSNSYEEQKEYVKVREKVEEQKQSAPSLAKSIGRACRSVLHFIRHTSFTVTRRDRTLIVLPSWVFALILLGTWKGLVPVMIVALIFGIRYSFQGPEDMKETEIANDFLNKAGSFADGVESGLKKEGNAAADNFSQDTERTETEQTETGHSETPSEDIR